MGELRAAMPSSLPWHAQPFEVEWERLTAVVRALAKEAVP